MFTFIYFRRCELLLHGGVKQHDDTVWVYDKFRNVSGICENPGLKQVVMNFGKISCTKKLKIKPTLGHLSGEQIYNKRIYLYASLKEVTKTTLVLKVRNDAFAPKADW